MLVPFPFTDLSGSKQRPALVVSPQGFHQEDLVVCAITSQVPARLTTWQVRLEDADLLQRPLPKPSVVLVGKLFTIRQDLIRSQFGRLRPAALQRVLERLRTLFEEQTERSG